MSSRALLSVTLACALLAAPAPAAFAQEASLGTFGDVPMEHWAWLTVETLVRKYQVMAGFPDQTFRGAKTVSRYELAAALGAVMDRMYARMGAVAPQAKSTVIDKADLAALRQLASSYDLKPLAERVTKLEADLEAAAGVGPVAVKVSGSSSTTWMDNTQDTVNPFLQTSLGLNLSTSVEGIDLSASVGGGVPGVTVGNKPATAGSGAAPDSLIHFREAHATTKVADFTVRTGLFSPAALFKTGTDLPFNWGGIVGNGFIYPNVNTVRWGDKNVSLAVSRELGPIKVSAASNAVIIVGGLEWKVAEMLRLRVSADTNHPDYFLSGANRAESRNFFGVADIGGEKLGMSLQGGFGKNLLQASGAVTWNPWGGIRLGVGAIFRSSDKATSELTPGATLFVPSGAPYLPALTLGIKEPQIVATTAGKTGPGSLLGELAGASVVTSWKLEDFGYPNIRLEYNIQQPVLGYQIYDATFALEAGRGF